MQTLCDGKDIQNMTITSETTIEDLEINDRDNYTENVEKNHKIYRFASVGTARKFMGEAFDNIMKRCGVFVTPGDHGSSMDVKMQSAGIKVEQRSYPPDEPLYRSGLYVYKRGELMGYVSSPFVRNSKLYLTPMVYIMTTEKDL